MTEVPVHVDRAAFIRALSEVGIPTAGLRSVRSDPRHLWLTYLAEVDGKKVIVGDHVAEVTHEVLLR